MRRQDRRVRLARRFLSLAPVAVLEVGYEDLCGDTTAGLRALQEFLGVDAGAQKLSSQFHRVNAISQRGKLENYEDVARRLSGTPYERLLD